MEFVAVEGRKKPSNDTESVCQKSEVLSTDCICINLILLMHAGDFSDQPLTEVNRKKINNCQFCQNAEDEMQYCIKGYYLINNMLKLSFLPKYSF